MNRALLSLFFFGASFCALHVAPPTAAAVTIDWVTVGDPGNAADPLAGRGAVNMDYRIGKYDVTNDQYLEFLNSNDPTGANTLGLYIPLQVVSANNILFDAKAPDGAKYSVVPGGNKLPVTWVSQFSAMRFANWLYNEQVPGATESGAYTLVGGSAVPLNYATTERSSGAKFFLPTVDEWYKAAYYDPVTDSYYKYPTSSNTPPAATSPTSVPNSTNSSEVVGKLTEVGAYRGTTSPFGAYDMGGNAWQWVENYSSAYGRVRGWSFQHDPVEPESAQNIHLRNLGDTLLTFRVAAAIPEPSTGVMAGIACALLCVLRKRLRRP